MDVLSFMIDSLRAELGADIFTDERRARFEREMRQQFGSDRHYIASVAAFERVERNASIVRCLMDGMSTREAAERFDMTERNVCKVRQQAIDAGTFKNGSVLP